MSRVSATRMNMLARRAQIRLATQGADLLKNKRDALLKEFMGLIQPLAAAREALAATLGPSLQQLVMAYALNGRERLASTALATRRTVDLAVEEKNVWGIRIADVEPFDFAREPGARGYALGGVPARIDELAEAFEKVMTAVVAMAPLEAKIKRLGEEIRKTSRRVNALEEVLVPRLSEEMDFIRATLEERDREDNFRLKKTKTKSQRESGQGN